MQTRDIAAIIFTNDRGEVLLQKKDMSFKRWPGRWCFFGGGLMENENPEEALKREIKEEMGYDLVNAELFTVYEYADADRQGRMYVYTAKYDKPISSISIGEGAGFAFFAKEEIEGLSIIDHDLIILKKFLDKIWNSWI